MVVRDTTWADVIAHRELLIKKKTTHCVICGVKLKPDRPDYFTEWCSTECALKDKATYEERQRRKSRQK